MLVIHFSWYCIDISGPSINIYFLFFFFFFYSYAFKFTTVLEKLEISGNFKNQIFSSGKLIKIKKNLVCFSLKVLEDNTGVRRVVVTPQSPECYPPSYSPAISPTHHLPPYMAPPPFIPNSHTAFYPPVSPGDIPPHQYYHHHIPPMYNEGRSAYMITAYSPLILVLSRYQKKNLIFQFHSQNW